MKNTHIAYNAYNIYSIPISFFKELNVKYVISDLDNTLDSAYKDYPCDEAIKLKKALNEINIELIIISNNHEERVKKYAEKLDVRYLAEAKKHHKKRIKNWLNMMNISVDDAIFVGDQIFTDRIYVKKINGRLILTEPLVKKDQFITRFVRWLDRLVRNNWKKKNKLGIHVGGENYVFKEK